MIKKVPLILLGIVIAVIISEVALRLSGFLFYQTWMRKEANRIGLEKRKLEMVEDIEDRNKILPEDSKLVKILCLGDSWTFGTGADPGYSYPAQLQVMLDKENLHKYKVYNLGIPGCHSGKLLRYLPGFLKKYQPNIVIILIGNNDNYNYFPSEVVYLSTWSKRLYFALASTISNLRVYKLIRLGLDGLVQKTKVLKKDVAYIDEKMRVEANQLAKTAYDLYIAGKVALAEVYFKKAIDIDPGNERAYFHLGHLYEFTKQYDKSLIIFEKLININPYTELRNEIYSFLFIMYQDLRLSQHNRDKLVYLIKRIPSDSEFKNAGAPFILSDKLTMKNLESNLVKITGLINLNKAILILQTYLNGDLSCVLRNFSKKYKIILIDNGKNLEELSDINNYFAPDGHPNEKGYCLMAENIYKALKKINK